jgi:hypothetical protein
VLRIERRNADCGRFEDGSPTLLACAQSRLGALALDELADLAADRRQCGNLFRIGYSDPCRFSFQPLPI